MERRRWLPISFSLTFFILTSAGSGEGETQTWAATMDALCAAGWPSDACEESWMDCGSGEGYCAAPGRETQINFQSDGVKALQSHTRIPRESDGTGDSVVVQSKGDSRRILITRPVVGSTQMGDFWVEFEIYGAEQGLEPVEVGLVVDGREMTWEFGYKDMDR